MRRAQPGRLARKEPRDRREPLDPPEHRERKDPQGRRVRAELRVRKARPARLEMGFSRARRRTARLLAITARAEAAMRTILRTMPVLCLRVQ